jgi:hypothetical protein
MAGLEPIILTPALLSHFTLFPELPTELRLKIWGHTARTQRLLKLQYCIVDRKFFTFQNLPAILQTTRESRAVGLCYYHLSFGTDKQPPSTYFNASDDIVCFGFEQYDDEIDYMIRYFEKQSGILEPRDQIQNLALAEYLWRRDFRYSPFAAWRGNWTIPKFGRTFPHLKQLICVKGQQASFDGEEESQEQIKRPGNYAGPLLVKSESGLDLMGNSKLALEAVFLSVQNEKHKHPERLCPDVAVMEIRYS